MSDVESNTPEEVAVVDQQEEGVKDLQTAIKRVLKNALIHDGLVRGIHEVAKALDSKRAQACFLADSCSEPEYKKLIKGLCKENKIPLIEVNNSKELGEYSGLCRIDNEGLPRKIVGASSVAIIDFGQQSM
ncbi:40S ribosomal protein S12, putative [Eimeria maxima]|uniref:40S ribosomal protein S12 n=1 Tax=Eimeria maxima TaxID=5804 RepID=U6M5N8_EIMMA|nr:40S ribosomal protein S12, putative [Eimeria maxima]CDJ58383.1 40S ribosomal protein S12, putative [Eimeria maxima]